MFSLDSSEADYVLYPPEGYTVLIKAGLFSKRGGGGVHTSSSAGSRRSCAPSPLREETGFNENGAPLRGYRYIFVFFFVRVWMTYPTRKHVACPVVTGTSPLPPRLLQSLYVPAID
ncbi:hypothetical protein CDAR_259211 [Caerostris darwini]|uniref:Uncharacterized protein n=1 Tax=Caerostris darwini TaxID=1538125 RepID=A0AAV4MAA0_9ARAC|nr:hypothetical protein CDAR_259211 [Caerostris darwini]